MNDSATFSGPHCPNCDAKIWCKTEYDSGAGRALIDTCAQCRWHEGLPIDAPQLPQPIAMRGNRVEALVFALIDSHYATQWTARDIVILARDIDKLLDE
jgi:hypothetical protein